MEHKKRNIMGIGPDKFSEAVGDMDGKITVGVYIGEGGLFEIPYYPKSNGSGKGLKPRDYIGDFTKWVISP